MSNSLKQLICIWILVLIIFSPFSFAKSIDPGHSIKLYSETEKRTNANKSVTELTIHIDEDGSITILNNSNKDRFRYPTIYFVYYIKN